MHVQPVTELIRERSGANPAAIAGVARETLHERDGQRAGAGAMLYRALRKALLLLRSAVAGTGSRKRALEGPQDISAADLKRLSALGDHLLIDIGLDPARADRNPSYDPSVLSRIR